MGKVAVILTCTFLLVSGAWVRASEPISPADFYKNNNATIIVGRTAGGGVDFAARVFASYWTEATGGAMVVKNRPGSSGLVAMNYLFNDAKRDGLTVGITIPLDDLVLPSIFENPSAKFDIGKFNYLGQIAYEPGAFAISPKLPYKSMTDLIRNVKELKLGLDLSLESRPGIAFAVVCELFGFKGGRLISGYGGSADVVLALARGEVDCAIYSVSAIKEQVKKGLIKPPLMVLANKRADLYFPNVPALPELIKDFSAEQEALWKFYLNNFGGTSRGFLAPPGVPDERVQFLRDAFDRMVKNKGFLRQIKMRYKVWPEPDKGADLTKIMEAAASFANDTEEMAKFKQLLQKYR